ncbi:MAG: helix-turn-helix transcriptional regulator [Oscillospiraceae bacterium]|nr:helix-turn-helix transcriptional regulator [Oscillospiraceae bacterium]
MARKMKMKPMRGVAPFLFGIHYTDGEKNLYSPVHIHRECEVYINVSGDVSFVVENRVYPILPGSVIITRPYECHHCVYHSDRRYQHYWILFSCEGNEWMLDLFFKRKAGEGNLLVLPPEERKELLQICRRMEGGNPRGAERHSLFFRILTLLERAEQITPSKNIYPEDILWALGMIGEHFAEPLTVQQLAESAHVSVNTMERHFRRFLQMTPRTYLQKVRLANSVRLLSQGSSVTEACTESGFSDCSSFIALFKRTYGATPLQYQKKLPR